MLNVEESSLGPTDALLGSCRWQQLAARQICVETLVSLSVSIYTIVLSQSNIFIFLGDEICHPPYGCFNDQHPFSRALVKLPRSPAVIGTKFILQTRDSWTTKFQIPRYLDPMFPESITKINYDGAKKTAVFVHGYLGKKTLSVLREYDAGISWSGWGAICFQASSSTRIVFFPYFSRI